jgi:DNA polymerase-3 subunit beta
MSALSMPILGSVLVEAAEGKVTLKATDLESGRETVLEAETAEPGSAAVPAKAFLDAVTGLTGQVFLKGADRDGLEISQPGYHAEIYGLDPKDFPSLPAEAGADGAEVPAVILAEAADKVLWSVTANNHNFNLAGVCADVREGRLALASSDSNALNVADLGPFAGKLEGQVLIPAKGIKLLKGLAEEEGAEGSLRLTFGARTLWIKGSRRALTLQLLSGKFPDYAGLRPTAEVKSSVTAPRGELEAVMKRVDRLSSVKYKTCWLAWNGERLSVSTDNPELGTMALDVPEATGTGEPFKTGLETKALLAAARAVKRSPTLEFRLRGDKTPLELLSDGLCWTVLSTVAERRD